GGDARERAGDPAGGDGRFVLQRLQGVRRHPIVHPDDLAVGWQNGTGPGVDRGETGGETGRQRFCQAVSHADLAGENSGKPWACGRWWRLAVVGVAGEEIGVGKTLRKPIEKIPGTLPFPRSTFSSRSR